VTLPQLQRVGLPCLLNHGIGSIRGHSGVNADVSSKRKSNSEITKKGEKHRSKSEGVSDEAACDMPAPESVGSGFSKLPGGTSDVVETRMTK
jgi:hypothetical protein